MSAPQIVSIPDPVMLRPPIALLTAEELCSLTPPQQRIKGVFPSKGLAAAAGPSGSGKSFLIYDAFMRAGAGDPWFGHQTAPCRWVYVGLEGQSGLANRAAADLKAHGDAGANNVRFIVSSVHLFDLGAMVALEDALCRFGARVAVIDTLNAAAPGADENSSADMGRIIESAKRLQEAIDGLVVLVHHTGKDTSRGLRGHSSLFAAMDAVIEVRREGDARSWRLAKSKDGADGEEHPFRLRVIELGTDEDGDPITSCVVEPEVRASESVRGARLPSGGNQRLVYDALVELLKEASHFGEGGAPPTRPCIQIEEVISKTRDRLAVEPDRKTERTRQALTGLINRGVIRNCGGWIFLA